MFTTPTKTPKFRLRSSDNPIRPNPGGLFFPPSSPFTPSPFKSPYARRSNLASSFSSSPKIHRVSGYTPSPHRSQRLSPGRNSVRPFHLNPEPALSALIEATSEVVQNTRLPLTPEEEIYFKELSRLGDLQSFNNALADARENVERRVKDGPFINAETNAQSQVQFRIKVELDEVRKAKKADEKAQIKRELARCKSFERRAKREREEEKRRHQDKLAERKRMRIEREQRAKEAQATSQRSCDPPSLPTEPTLPHTSQPMQTDQDIDALAAQRIQEELKKARLGAEAQARLAAQQEEARLQEETKRLEEERFHVEMERFQAAKARRRAEEERARAEMEFARAEEERRKAEEIRQWAQRQQEERLCAMQEDARLAAQRKAEKQAQREAERREQEARVQAEREAFAQRQAEMRYIAEQVENSFSERRARLAELRYLEELFEARLRAELEEIAKNASRPRNPLAEFYIRQAAQRAAEQEQAQQQYTHSPPQGNYAGGYEQNQSYSSDIPMREPPMGEPPMDASMHSICDEITDVEEPPLQPQAPPPPPTIAQRFAIWETKWKDIDSRDNLFTVPFHRLPWPVLHDITSVADITSDHIREFLSHPDRPSHLSPKKVVSFYHSDKFEFRVMRKIHPHQQMLVAEIANHCTILLVNHMR